MRILFVGMPHSVHTARWIELVSDRGWDIHLFPSQVAPTHAAISGVTVHRPLGEPTFASRKNGVIQLARAGSTRSRRLAPLVHKALPFADPRDLARTIRKVKPDLVHSLETQAAGYMTLDAREMSDSFPTWMLSNWGSDIYLFGRLAEHTERIRAVLAACDAYHCECVRDVELAHRFGFTGHVFPVTPISGGFDLDAVARLRKAGPTSRRSLVVLKGYNGWAGRAMFGLRALECTAPLLAESTIAITLAGEEMIIAAELLAERTGLDIDVIPQVPVEDILALLGRARVAIGLNISDAISTSMLEAMVMGAFPIQSFMSCAHEWVQDGTNGLLVHPEDVDGIVNALHRALTDDELVDRASAHNLELAADRLDRRKIRVQVGDAYERVPITPRT